MLFVIAWAILVSKVYDIICHRPWCDKELQGCAHTKLPCCMFFWSSFHVFFVQLGGIHSWLHAFQWCPSDWFLHPKGEVLPCRCWLCLVRGAAHPLSKCAVPFIWMESCQWSVHCSSFLKLLTLMFFQSPCNPKELFNLHHVSACNVIEQIFGVLKQHFRILQLPPEYDMNVQALIPPALAALHNFIWQYDPGEIQLYDDQLVDFQMGFYPESTGELVTHVVTLDETARANERRDRIMDDMWEQYQQYQQ